MRWASWADSRGWTPRGRATFCEAAGDAVASPAARGILLALSPAGPTAKKSWYLRAEDDGSFETWRWALEQAGVPPPDDDAGSSRGDHAGADGEEPAPSDGGGADARTLAPFARARISALAVVLPWRARSSSMGVPASSGPEYVRI